MKIFPSLVENKSPPFLFLFTLSISLTSTYSFTPLSSSSGGISAKLWHELGRGIGNEKLSDLAGYAVATSDSGYTVAVGSPKHTSLFEANPPYDAGRVRVYEYSPRRDGWSKRGQDLEGDYVGDEFGRSVALSDDGSVVAVGTPNCDRFDKREVGCVRVYSLDIISDPDSEDEEKEVWLQLGEEIVGEEAFDHFGTAIQVHTYDDVITDSESYLIGIGAPGKNSGAVYMYKFSWEEGVSTLEWNRQAVIQDSEVSQLSRFGSALSMTNDSKTIAIGAPKHGDKREGIMCLYRQNDEGDWVRSILPDNLDINKEGESCGSSVSIDPSGHYIAYGCPQATEGMATEIGKVKFLKKTVSFDGTISWSRSEIIGESQSNLFGASVELSEIMDGHIFAAIGAPKNSRFEGGTLIQNTGHIRVYYNTDDGDWEQAGLDVEGLSEGDEFGSSVAISREGHIVVGGAPLGAGYAKIYKLDYTAPPSPAPTVNVNAAQIERKRVTSAWIVFIISTFSIISIVLAFLFMRKIRDNYYYRKSERVPTSTQDGLVELSQVHNNIDVGVVRQTTVVPGDDSPRDII